MPDAQAEAGEGEGGVFTAAPGLAGAPDPGAALAGIRRALRPGGVLVMIESAATGELDADTGPPGALLAYASSVGHCMQVSLAVTPSWPIWPSPGSPRCRPPTPRPA